jgi:hypothetical protein
MAKPLRIQSGGVSTRIDVENLGGGRRRVHVQTSEDVAAAVKHAADIRTSGLRHRRNDAEAIDQQPFAVIPPTVIMEMISKHNFNIMLSPARNGMTREEFQRKLRHLLNTEYPNLKAYNGRL